MPTIGKIVGNSKEFPRLPNKKQAILAVLKKTYFY